MLSIHQMQLILKNGNKNSLLANVICKVFFFSLYLFLLSTDCLKIILSFIKDIYKKGDFSVTNIAVFRCFKINFKK